MTATVGDLKNYISDKWRDYCAADPTRTKPCEFRTRFKDWEAEFFMSGLKRNLFSIVAPCNCKTAAQCHLHYKALGEEVLKNFFDKGGVGAGREAVTQFAAITQLMDI